MIATKIEQLKKATEKEEMLSILSEITAEAEKKSFPTVVLKRHMIDMLTSSIEIYIAEYNTKSHTTHSKKILDTFAFLDTL